MTKKKKVRITEKIKLGINLEHETLVKLEEIKLTYLRQGKKVKIGEVVAEALNKLWKDVCKK